MESWIQGPRDIEAWPLSREHTNSPDYPVVYELSACAYQSPVGFIPHSKRHIIQILTAYHKIIKLVTYSSLRGENVENCNGNNIQPVPQYVLNNNFSSDLIKKTVKHFLESNQRSAANESNISSAIWLQVLNTWCSKAFFLHWNAIKASNILIKSLIQSTVSSSHVTALQSVLGLFLKLLCSNK